MFALRALAIASLLTSSAAFAASSLVVNGSLEGTIARNTAPTGWSVMGGSPDVMNAANNVGVAGLQYFGAAPKASPDGGTWVGLGADTGLSEGISQVLKGLTVGQQYTVSWSAGNFGYSRGSVQYLGDNAINVMLDGQSIGTGGNLALGSDWFKQTLSFVATSASQQLAFSLASSTKSYLSLDGIAVQATVVPEPGTFALMSVALGGLFVLSRRRKVD